MDINEAVIDALNELDFKQQTLFALSCTERSLELYKLFDTQILLEELKPLTIEKSGFDSLNELLNEGYEAVLENKLLSAPKLSEYIKQCYQLAPSDEEYGDFQANMAQYIANSLAYAFKFYEQKDFKYLAWCSDSLIEVINITESEKFYQEYPDGDAEEVLEEKMEEEVEIELDIVSKLKASKDFLDFRKYVQARKIVL